MVISFIVVTAVAFVSSGQDRSDYGLRHPNAAIAISAPDLSDYALRHPEPLHPAAPDLSDWYLRHRAEFGK